MKKHSSTFLRHPELLGSIKIPKMPKNLEHQDFSESAQNVWAEMKLFSTFIIFLGRIKSQNCPNNILLGISLFLIFLVILSPKSREGKME